MGIAHTPPNTKDNICTLLKSTKKFPLKTECPKGPNLEKNQLDEPGSFLRCEHAAFAAAAWKHVLRNDRQCLRMKNTNLA